MNEEFEMICFQIISNSGAAKSNYVEAIQKAKEKDYAAAKELMEGAEEFFVGAHKVHADLIQKEAQGQKTEFSLLFMHAEIKWQVVKWLSFLPKNLFLCIKK